MLCGVPIIAAETYIEGNYEYTVEDGKATIINYPDSEELIKEPFYIPERLGGYPVIAIGDEAFYESKLREVIIPEGIECIGASAFDSCLKRIQIPASVKSLEVGFSGGCAPELIEIDEDAQKALKYALKIESFDDADILQILAGDMDGNGKIELTDARKILKMALKIE